MPLSEHEQRILEQIERSLVAEDPKFASQVRAATPGRIKKRKAILSGTGFFIGLVGLVAGVITGYDIGGFLVISMAGFLVMFISGVYFVSSRRGPTLTVVDGKKKGGNSGRPSANHPSSKGLTKKMEDRWRRRQGDDLR